MMGDTLLFVVEEVLQNAGRGCVLLPGPVIGVAAAPKAGEWIRLVTPEGDVLETEIRGLGMISHRSREGARTAPLLLPPGVTRDQVPVGTRVYLRAPADASRSAASDGAH